MRARALPYASASGRNGSQPSYFSATRASTLGVSLPASQSGGPPGVAGFGSRSRRSACQNLPSKSQGLPSSPECQAVRRSAAISSSRPTRPAKEAPTEANSSSVSGIGKPEPSPRTSRPAATWSRLAIMWEPISGWRRAGVNAAVPT